MLKKKKVLKSADNLEPVPVLLVLWNDSIFLRDQYRDGGHLSWLLTVTHSIL